MFLTLIKTSQEYRIWVERNFLMLPNPLDLRILQQEDTPFQREKLYNTECPQNMGKPDCSNLKQRQGVNCCLTPALFMSPSAKSLTSGVKF